MTGTVLWRRSRPGRAGRSVPAGGVRACPCAHGWKRRLRAETRRGRGAQAGAGARQRRAKRRPGALGTAGFPGLDPGGGGPRSPTLSGCTGPSPPPRPRWPGCHPVGPGCLPSALPWSGSTCRSPFVTSRPCARPLNRLLGGGSSPAHAGLALECRPDPGTSLPPGRRASLGAGLPRSLLLPLGRVSAAALRGLAQRPGGPAPRTAGPGHGSAS